MFILSLDGGGIRGVLTARLIERICEEFPQFYNSVEFVAGTSTGGLLAMAFSIGMSTKDMVALYRDNGKDIFKSRGFLDSLTHLDELVRANYSNEGLKQQLAKNFGEKRLKDAQIPCMVSTFDLKAFRPRFMLSDGMDRDITFVEAGLRTSAAPTFFPTAGQFCDGGVVANNPADCAIAELLGRGLEKEDIYCLSIGTGFNPRSIEGGDWGLKQWTLPDMDILHILMDGGIKASEYRARQMLQDRHFRLNPQLPRVFPMDDPEVCDELIDIADDMDLDATFKFLDRVLD